MTSPAHRSLRFERLVVGLVALGTYLPELLLAERKYGFLTGGFGQSHTLDRPGELALFVVTTGLAQLLLVALLYRLFRALVRAPARRDERLFHFAFVTGAVAALAVAIKLELLSYFSDTISFQLIRNLGGGSLADAAFFALSETGLYAIYGAVALAVYLAALWVIRRRARRAPVPPATAPAIAWATIAGVFAALLVAAFLADRDADVRIAAPRMNGYFLVQRGLALATDVDRDGYGSYGWQLDPKPFDGTVYPFRLDVPGDGIDQDGLAGDFRMTAPPPPAFVAPPLPAGSRNLVLIVLESTRADVIGKRIDGRLVAPNLTALAAAGSSLPEAYSHVGYTTASLKSLFSGRLDPPLGTGSIFRDMKRAGYRVAVFSGQPEGFGDIDTTVGERASSDVFVDADTLKNERAFSFAAQGSLLVDEAKLLREFDRHFGQPRDWARPAFVYFNFQSPHFPYHHDGMADLVEPHPLPRGEISLANRDRTARTYWNAVAYADRRIGDLIARLKRLGVWDHTLLAVTADHGESLFDDGFLGHGHIINREQTHIPLVLSQKGVVVPGPIGLLDYRRLLLTLLAGRPAPQSAGPAFQHIGALAQPAVIGQVGPGFDWTTYDFGTGAARLGDRRVSYPELAPGSADRARVDALIRAWERERWLATR